MMNNELKPYDKYKETGLFWLSHIPEKWDWRYLSQISGERCIKNGLNTDKYVLSLSYGKIIRKKNVDFGLVPKEYSNYQVVEEGNIILRLTDLQNDKRSLRTGLVKEKGIITSAYTCLEIKRDIPGFIHYVLHAYDLMKVFYGMGGGVRQSIGYQDIRKIRLPIPSKEEQEKIVKYLDIKISEINKYILAKKNQINHLRELIDYYTNKCIEDSQSEWVRFINIVDIVGDSIERFSNETYIPIGLYNRGRGVFRKPEVSGDNLGDSTFYRVENDTLIFSGQFAWEGAVAYSGNENVGCIASHRYPMVRGKSEIVESKYLWAFFISHYGSNLLNQHSRGAAGRNRPLNFRTLLKEKIAVPRMEEQLIISRLVDKYKFFIEEFNREHQFLTEYRNSLIVNTVTGKYDFRDYEILDIENCFEEKFDFDDEDNNEAREDFIDEGGDE